MAHKSDLIADDIDAYLKVHEYKSLLRFITCGSVDDGKSTLIGRLLFEAKMIFEDQLVALTADSKKSGTQGDNIDFALLVDGLASERGQGITIDVAYRFFSTDKRKFIVADTPGHEQYTRNMATGASTADLAIILIDARRGILTQTRRHSFIVSLLGIREVVLAINKMDVVGYDQQVFDEIEQAYRTFAENLPSIETITSIPMSALVGDNIVERSENTPWYKGPSLMDHLENVAIEDDAQALPMRMPVQWVNRPNLDFRGFSGQLCSGNIKPGDAIKIMPSAKQSSVKRIVTHDGDLEVAVAGQSITLTLADEIDISRGDVICTAGQPTQTGAQFRTTILWMSDDKMFPGRPYTLKIGAERAQMSISPPKHKINVNTMAEEPARNLELNEIAVCDISLDKRIAFDPYPKNRLMGGFIIIDKITQATVGMGMIDYALRRSQNVHWQATDVSRQARAAIKGHKPVVLWFTGLSGSGKSSIANIVDKKLVTSGAHTMLLDGDNVRHGLNKDLGFSSTDRVENIRRIGEVAKLMVDAGLITLVSFISPFRAERRLARSLVPEGEFICIFVDTPMAIAEKRDVKGLYKKARAGEIKNFTGVTSPYEPPEHPDIHIDTTKISADKAAEIIIEHLFYKDILLTT